ncbi:amidase signature enzyme [Penicillium herquei]|nr:amidase signature enzyme [Penicillium herquei]
MAFNVLTTNAVELQQLLRENKITSAQIVEQYLTQIDRYKPKLNALISPAPRDKVLKVAKDLDEERQRGQIRSPFHGIPIILKDSFVTAAELGMSTTVGSHAFVGAKALKNGAITQQLIDAGLIILGKGNMTEFAGMKMTMMMPGWSAHGGQTFSPYVGKIEENEKILGHSAPGGSSTGSAVAVAAGFSPLAMATETIGSIVTPSTRAGLYALKFTTGIQDTTGLYTMTDFFDSPGPMAKSAVDVRVLSEILLGRQLNSPAVSPWEGLSVGFLDPKIWCMSPEFCPQFEGTAEQMSRNLTFDARSRNTRRVFLLYDWQAVSSRTRSIARTPLSCQAPYYQSHANWDFKNLCIPRFVDLFHECPITSVEDIVKFNKENAEKALPAPFTEQNDLEGAMKTTDKKDHIDELKNNLRKAARDILDEVFENEGINILAAPGDSSLCIHAAAAGYPIVTVPIGKLHYNARPFGLCLVARANEEKTLLQFMESYEKVAQPRPIPNI